MFQYEDQLSLNLISGSGGDGCVSFFSTRTKPRGGPDGGDGGSGGSLFFMSSSHYRDFEHLKGKKKYQADSGRPGGSQLKQGRKGQDFILQLPLGTLVRNEKGQILKDFPRAEKELFLEGGRGGHGNAFFKNSLNQAPRKFQKGEKGQSCKVVLELKPVIQIAIIGKVNTGKSSFFNLVTRAESKVADYPYTTLVPHIGQIKGFDSPGFVMDIPGLEKSASDSLSKGLSFLRSIQRTGLVLHFVDSCSEQPLKEKEEIEKELKAFDNKYNEDYFISLSKKKKFLVFTKVDELKDFPSFRDFVKNKEELKEGELFFLSNRTKKGLKDLLGAIKAVINQSF